MVTIDKIQNGIAKYMDMEFLPTIANDELQKFAMGVSVSILIKRFDKILASGIEHPILKLLELANSNGEIDIDILKDTILEKLPESGLKVELSLPKLLGGSLNLTFMKDDVEKIYSYITE